MTIKIVTSFSHLMKLAVAVGQAKKSGNKIELEKAISEHDAYKDLCLKADCMSLNKYNSDLS